MLRIDLVDTLHMFSLLYVAQVQVLQITKTKCDQPLLSFDQLSPRVFCPLEAYV